MKTLFKLTSIAFALTGCASTQVKEVVNQQHMSAEAVIAEARKSASPKGADKQPIILPPLKTPYLGKKSMAAKPASAGLPKDLVDPTTVHFTPNAQLTLDGFARLLAEETKLPVRVEMPSKQGQMVTPIFLDIAALPPMPLQSLLNVATSAYGVDWDWIDGVLYLQSTFRKNYPIYLAASKTTGKMVLGKTSSTQSGTNQQSTGSFQSSLESNFENNSDPWDDVEKSVKAIAGDGNVTSNRALSLVSVNCSKACHKLVKEYVDTVNHTATRMVFFRINEITVATTSTGQSGVDWGVVYKRLGAGKRNFQINMLSPASVLSNAATGALGINILNPPDGTDASRFEETAALVRAISAASKVVDHKPYDMIALNNEPATFTSADQQVYVQSTSVIPTGVGGTPVFSQTAGYITFGQMVQVIPTVLPGGDIVVRFGLDDTKLKKIIYGSKQGEVDKPLLGMLNANTKIILKNGATLLLTGFKRNTASLNEAGILPDQRLGTEAGDTEATETIITITPVLVGTGQ
ncbi:MAG TPA: hypothetical protein VEC35_09500 [Noviherbaspirillum sp.]|nr:hypothetical protein [Noviherbaspirillum sp.]